MVPVAAARLWRRAAGRYRGGARPLRDHGRRRRQSYDFSRLDAVRREAARGLRPGHGQPLQGRHRARRHAGFAPVPGQPGALWLGPALLPHPHRRLPLRAARLQSRPNTGAGAVDAGHGVRQRDGRPIGPGRLQDDRGADHAVARTADPDPLISHLARRLAPPALPADLQPALAIPLSRPGVADRGPARRCLPVPGRHQAGQPRRWASTRSLPLAWRS